MVTLAYGLMMVFVSRSVIMSTHQPDIDMVPVHFVAKYYAKSCRTCRL